MFFCFPPFLTMMYLCFTCTGCPAWYYCDMSNTPAHISLWIHVHVYFPIQSCTKPR